MDQAARQVQAEAGTFPHWPRREERLENQRGDVRGHARPVVADGHAYAALVLPVLLGITVDEGMFLLHHARAVSPAGGADVITETLRHEGPPVAATALTTAAGFAALGFCDFDGLRDLGWVGALGSTVGLGVALVVVPAGLRLTSGARRGRDR